MFGLIYPVVSLQPPMANFNLYRNDDDAGVHVTEQLLPRIVLLALVIEDALAIWFSVKLSLPEQLMPHS